MAMAALPAPAAKVFARVAHEVRTPLSSLLMWLRLLRAGEVQDVEMALAAIEKSAQDLSQVIEELDVAARSMRSRRPAPKPRRSRAAAQQGASRGKA